MEFRSAEVLDDAKVVRLLADRGIAPMVAAPADADPEELMRVLALYDKAGLDVCLWPLVSDADGYWPSTTNTDAVARRCHVLLECAARARVRIAWIAIDLEPRLEETQALRRGGIWDAVGAGAKQLLSSRPRFEEARASYRKLADEVRARGARTLAIAYPFVVGDPSGKSGIQARCEAPLDAGWDRVSVMTYGSLLAGYSRGLLSPAAARWYSYRVYRALIERYGEVGAFVGIVGHGKLGDEQSYVEPAELQHDAAAARAAGVSEVTGYCLEGILGTNDPERWLDALVRAEVKRPAFSIRGEAMHRGVLVAGAALSLVAK